MRNKFFVWGKHTTKIMFNNNNIGGFIDKNEGCVSMVFYTFNLKSRDR